VILGYRLAPGRVSMWPWGAFAVPDAYVQATLRGGGLPAIVPPSALESTSAPALVDRFDALMLCGGGDVEPSRFGVEPTDHLYGVDPGRDRFEVDVLRAAEAADAPTLAICRGLQVLNVAFGGTLHQHLPEVPGMGPHGVPPADEAVLHGVEVDPSSLIARVIGSTSLKGLAHHHQGIDRLGDGLVATGRTDDGLVEAVERPGWWMLAVQWHPEETAQDDPQQQALFDALIDRAREARRAAAAS
jgi:putative glutamine amidotransferase